MKFKGFRLQVGDGLVNNKKDAVFADRVKQKYPLVFPASKR
jgi:hypothetical protein